MPQPSLSGAVRVYEPLASGAQSIGGVGIGGASGPYARLGRRASPRQARYSNDGHHSATLVAAVRSSLDDSLTAAAPQPNPHPHCPTSAARAVAPAVTGDNAQAEPQLPSAAAVLGGGANLASSTSSFGPQYWFSGSRDLRSDVLRATTEGGPAAASDSPPGGRGVVAAARSQPTSRRATGSPRSLAEELLQQPSATAAVAGYLRRAHADASAAAAGVYEQGSRSATATAAAAAALVGIGTGALSQLLGGGGGHTAIGLQASMSASTNAGLPPAPPPPPLVSRRNRSRRAGRMANTNSALSQLDARKLAAMPLEEMLEHIQAAIYAEDIARGRRGSSGSGSSAGEPSPAPGTAPGSRRTSRTLSGRRRQSAPGPRSAAAVAGPPVSEAAPGAAQGAKPSGTGRRRRRVKTLSKAAAAKRKARAEAAAAAAQAAAMAARERKEAGQPVWRHGGRALAFSGFGIAGTSISAAAAQAAQLFSPRASHDSNTLRGAASKKHALPSSPAPVAKAARKTSAAVAPSACAPSSAQPRSAQKTAQKTTAKTKPAKTATKQPPPQPQTAIPAVQHTVLTFNPLPLGASGGTTITATPMNTPAPASRSLAPQFGTTPVRGAAIPAATATATPVNTPAPANRSPVTTQLDLSVLLSRFGGDVGVIVGASSKTPAADAPEHTAEGDQERSQSNSKLGTTATATPAAKAIDAKDTKSAIVLEELVRLMTNAAIDGGNTTFAVASVMASARRSSKELLPPLSFSMSLEESVFRSHSSSIVAMAMGGRGTLSSPFKATGGRHHALRCSDAEYGAAAASGGAGTAPAVADLGLLMDTSIGNTEGSLRRYTRSGDVAAYDIHAAAAEEAAALVYNAALSPRTTGGGEEGSCQTVGELPLQLIKSALLGMSPTRTHPVGDLPPMAAGTGVGAAVVVDVNAGPVPQVAQMPLVSPRQVALPVTPRMPEGCGDWRGVSLVAYEQSLGDFDAFLATPKPDYGGGSE
ncbi:hypothetical protein GPECTOR_4g843 [Gonium pectorale]|uniref:Uncharacterized protein n=1 Tax=Gonium pectorale TaxID=33097 RepID=A0A150GYD4_GONPE|nr:hypothetical protein GPECTOR_4g843 [Gonium pectorale]|eukprot:KXZ54773.1 hypothetical protein GPECTOR_4g843 [Gonium pectorale]